MAPPPSTPDARPPEARTQGPRPLDALEATIRQRAEALLAGGPVEKSWTAKLLAGDLKLIAGKVTEEAAELVEAAADLEANDQEANDQEADARTHLIAEAGDLLYHTMVLLRRAGVDLAEVEAELARRFGISGIEEKANRGATDKHP